MKHYSKEYILGSVKKNIHIVIISVFLIIAVIIVAKLMIWNLGTQSDYDPNDILEGFDTECNDQTFHMSDEDLALRVDDGVHTVLVLGNDQMAYGEAGTKVPDFIREKTGCNVINCAFPGTIAAAYDRGSNPNDAFCFYFLAIAMVNQDFSFQETNLETATCVDSTYASTLETLKQLQLESVDTLIIGYDASDYLANVGLWNPNDNHDVACFHGAVYAGVDLFRKFYPQMQIIISSPTYAQYVKADGSVEGGDTYDAGNGELFAYVLQEGAVGNGAMVNFVDNYFATVNADNYKDYMVDHIHLNKDGRQLLAKRVGAFID